MTVHLMTSRATTARHIIRAAAVKLDLSVNDLTGRGRERHIAHPRQCVMTAIRRKTGLSLPQIGALMGNRDHTTIIHGLSAVIERNDSAEAAFIADLIAAVTETGQAA